MHFYEESDQLIKQLEIDLNIYKQRLYAEQMKNQALVERLSAIHSLLLPSDQQVDGKVYKFIPQGTYAEDALRILTDRIRAIGELHQLSKVEEQNIEEFYTNQLAAQNLAMMNMMVNAGVSGRTDCRQQNKSADGMKVLHEWAIYRKFVFWH